jgi:hypothetical protein
MEEFFQKKKEVWRKTGHVWVNRFLPRRACVVVGCWGFIVEGTIDE